MSKRDLSVPMTKSDAYQMCLFAHMEISCNLLLALAIPNSRRYNSLKEIEAQFDSIDKTYRGYLPDHWIETSKAFELKMQHHLSDLHAQFDINDKPVVEPPAPQIPKRETKKRSIITGGSMKDQIKKIEELMDAFKVDAAKAEAGNKSAGVRARKASLVLTKELKTFRAMSTAA